MLGSRTNRRQHLVRISRRENENHVWWRFLQCLQESRRGRLGELVYFVEDVHLPSPGCSVPRAGNYLSDGVDAVVRRGVEFDDVKRRSFGDGKATGARSTRVTVDGILTVEGLGEDARRGGFSRPARSRKEIGVRDAIVLDGSLQRAYDVVLAPQSRRNVPVENAGRARSPRRVEVGVACRISHGTMLTGGPVSAEVQSSGQAIRGTRHSSLRAAGFHP